MNPTQNYDPSQKKKAAWILYITLAVVVSVGAIVGGVLLANRDTQVTPPPQNNTGNTDIPTGGENNPPEETIPQLMAPAVGLVTKNHDMETLVYSITTNDWRVHRGIDIATAAGAEVVAAADGVITEIVDDPLYGKTIVISHAGGAVTRYSNLGPELAEGIEVGKKVSRGQVIGVVGETAGLEIAEEPHLHFEMTIQNEQVDPMDYIASSEQSSLFEDIAYEG